MSLPAHSIDPYNGGMLRPPNYEPYVPAERPLNEREVQFWQRERNSSRRRAWMWFCISLVGFVGVVVTLFAVRGRPERMGIVAMPMFASCLVSSIGPWRALLAVWTHFVAGRVLSLGIAWDYELPPDLDPREWGDEEHPWEEYAPSGEGLTLYPGAGARTIA